MKGNNISRSNYFSKNIKEKGEGFLDTLDVKRLRSDARRIFNDIAFGNIDFDKYWMYFTEPMLINALIDVSSTQFMIHQTCFNALVLSTQQMTSPDSELVKRYCKRRAEAYQLFMDYFMNVKASGFSGDAISQLKTLSNRVHEYAQDLVDPVFANTNSCGEYVSMQQMPRRNNSYTLLSEPAPELSDLQEEVGLNLTLKEESKKKEVIHPIWTIR